jgi:hypothetical protein
MRVQTTGLHLALLVLIFGLAAVGAQQVKIEKIPYFNQPNCYKLSNGTAEVIVTTDIGPRVIAYRFIGEDNILGELGPDAVVKTDLGDWHPWGGHRLWHAPESKPRSYVPDDSPIKAEIVGTDGVRLTQPVEKETGIRKEMLVKLDSAGARVTLTQTLTNKGLWPVDLAPWGLTIMNGGGVTIFPNEPYIPHSEKLLPARAMVLWHYTDLSDPRWTFGKKFIRLRTDSKLNEPNKVGAANKQGWAAYLRQKTLFIKRFPYVEGANYPDLGCNFETYTAGDFMEIETLGPMVKLGPGESTTHIEHWYLFKGVEAGNAEKSLEAAIMPLVEKAVTK